ncbi:MAG TPA: RluA family pseudouridine synthase [Actinomycetota bacterium]|nr:RluA family pseudouridine synthase [Actinomycetota bacterium]
MRDERFTAEAGRLDAVLARLTGRPRAEIQRAIDAGRVRVDGASRPRSHRLEGGETLDVAAADDVPVPAEGPPVPIRYEDEHLLVVAKPAGLVVHPTEARRSGTLVSRLLGMGVPLAARGGRLRPGIVHRLDVGTSGLLVVAKTDEAHAALEGMMRRHETERRYVALVRGAVEPDAFTVDAPLGRRAARIVVDRVDGRRAETLVEVRERLARCTLVEAVPRTGRTHQIRVHLAALGHPILGDRTYGGAGEEAARIGLTRPFLHARALTFTHPIDGRLVAVEEPLPTELVEALARARDDLQP